MKRPACELHGRRRDKARGKLSHVVRLESKLAEVADEPHGDPLLLAIIHGGDVLAVCRRVAGQDVRI